MVIFCVLRELVFASGKNWFFLLGINFCVFWKLRSSGTDNIFVFCLSENNRDTDKTTCKCKTE